MGKRLISKKIRGGGRPAGLALLLLLTSAGESSALSIGCVDGDFNPVACGTPAAVRCEYPSPEFIGECQSLGYGDYGDTFGYMCVDSTCTTAPVAVPELEDFAAVAFLVLALTIGWHVRRCQIPAA